MGTDETDQEETMESRKSAPVKTRKEKRRQRPTKGPKKTKRKRTSPKKSRDEESGKTSETGDVLNKVREILSKLPLQDKLFLLGVPERSLNDSCSPRSRKNMYLDLSELFAPLRIHDDSDEDDSNSDSSERKSNRKKKAKKGKGKSKNESKNENVNLNVNMRRKKGIRSMGEDHDANSSEQPK